MKISIFYEAIFVQASKILYADIVSTQKNNGISAWHAFLRAHSQVIRALERKMEEDSHLPLNWFDILAWLSSAPDGQLRMQVLADSMYLSNSGLTRLLDRMTAAGFVERQNCPDDRRGWYAVITTKGRETFERAFPGHVRSVEEYFLSCFNKDELEILHSLLSRLTEPSGEVKRKVQIR